MKKTALGMAVCLSLLGQPTWSDPVSEKPNVLLIVADDLGFSDISPFGGEIPTPNLQTLAEEGVKFSQYYTSPMSAPARSMIMTGNTNHQAGMGGMWWYETTEGKDGYEMQLTDRVETMPEVFQKNGYETLMAGKWHIGFKEGARPTDRGFNHAYAFMGGGASHFADVVPLGSLEKFHTYYTLDGNKVTPPDDFYSSTFYANILSEWIEATPKDQPVFAYLAFTAPHDPIQAPDEWIVKFKDEYHEGYQPIYDARMQALKNKGLLSEDAVIPDLQLKEKWAALSDEERNREVKKMQVYAAMVAQMDDQIGSVFKTLKDTGRLDNTIILFVTDNGANPGGRELYDEEEFWQSINVDDSIENLGRKGSFASVGKNWADVNNAPYQVLHKTTSAQGGINTNFILSAPMLHPDLKGGLSQNYIAAFDLAPTLYDLTGITVDLSKGRLPHYGISHKANLVDGANQQLRNDFAIELHNQAAYIEGDWKIRRLSSTYPTATMGEWLLFDIKNDPLETQNLADKHPEKLNHLSNQYEKYRQNTLVIDAEGEFIPYGG